MRVKVIDNATGLVALFANSERIARNWLRESEEAPADFSIVPDESDFCRDCGEPGERTGHMGCQYPR